MFANAGCCCASSCCELLTDEEVDRYRKDIAEAVRIKAQARLEALQTEYNNL